MLFKDNINIGIIKEDTQYFLAKCFVLCNVMKKYIVHQSQVLLYWSLSFTLEKIHGRRSHPVDTFHPPAGELESVIRDQRAVGRNPRRNRYNAQAEIFAIQGYSGEHVHCAWKNKMRVCSFTRKPAKFLVELDGIEPTTS